MKTNPLIILDTDMRRFWAKVTIDPSGCLLWTAGKSGSGYGRFFHGTRFVQAHRFAYTALVGSIPEGLQLDHLCRQRACVAPDHLEPVTPRTNLLRGVGPSAVHAATTKCPQGHEYSDANTYRAPSGWRQCRTCHRARERARRAAQRANGGAA
ncbi:HNH endonuclease signature motif containing protein [Streptomyces sp. NPDC059544]|uniref:HNH endonuclease signature motif containing protein n=1 Tax=Streptomyces sp. NPDC059544 TaxID=3346861 RepID=UPI0036D13640